VVAHSGQISGSYHVADDETTRWREYYAALATGFGVDVATVHRVPGDRYRAGLHGLLDVFKSVPPYRWLKNRLSSETKAALKLQLRRALERDRPAQRSASGSPVVTRDMWHLQTTRYRLPTTQFRATFGHHNHTSFASGMAASLAWLRFSGLDGRDAAAETVPNAAGATALTAGRES